MFAFSYCYQSYIINDMDDEVFAVYTFFMCILVKVEVFAFSKCFFFFLRLVEGLSFHYSLSVCLCVCVCLSVCPALLVNKIPAERMHRFRRGFR